MLPSLSKVAIRSLNAETESAQRKISKGKCSPCRPSWDKFRGGLQKLLLGVGADVVDEHLLRKNRGVVGRPGPIAANGNVEDNEEGVIENPAGHWD